MVPSTGEEKQRQPNPRDRQQHRPRAAHPCGVSELCSSSTQSSSMGWAYSVHELGWFGVKTDRQEVSSKAGLCPAVFYLPPSACCCAGRRELPPHPLCSRAVQKAAGSCREPACLACRRERRAKPCLVPRSSRPGAANCCWKELGAWGICSSSLLPLLFPLSSGLQSRDGVCLSFPL